MIFDIHDMNFDEKLTFANTQIRFRNIISSLIIIKETFARKNLKQVKMKMDKNCFVLLPNLTVSFVNNPSIDLVVGAFKTDVIKLLFNNKM